MKTKTSKTSQPGRTRAILLAPLFGFIGGIVASLFIFGLNKYPAEVLQEGHPLLSAPFLAFITVILIAVVFHKPLYRLLSRGHVTIKWGDKEISLSEIEKSFDAEFNELESKLADLDAEIREIRSELDARHRRGDEPAEDLAPKADEDMADLITHGPGGMLPPDTFATMPTVPGESLGRGSASFATAVIRDAFDWIDSEELAALVYHLGVSKYTWRNRLTLAKRTGIVEERIDTLLRAFPDEIVRSISKKGNVIYRLTYRAKAKYIQVVDENA